MSSTKNRVIREELERIYGKGCMFQRAYVADRLRQLGVPITYGTYKKKYKLNQQKTLERRMTLHHLKHVSESGKTTLENGAVVNELAHRYLHSLPRQIEEQANNMIRDWKRDKDNGYDPFEGYEECQVELAPEEELETPFELDAMTFDINIQGKIKSQKSVKKKKNRTKKRKKRRIRKRYYGGER